MESKEPSVVIGGKRHEDLILPINDSISMTLSTDEVNIAKI